MATLADWCVATRQAAALVLCIAILGCCQLFGASAMDVTPSRVQLEATDEASRSTSSNGLDRDGPGRTQILVMNESAQPTIIDVSIRRMNSGNTGILPDPGAPENIIAIPFAAMIPARS